MNFIRMFFDAVLKNKFNIRVPLFLVIMSLLWTVWRSADFAQHVLMFPVAVAWATSVSIEGGVTGAAALAYVALCGLYERQLKKMDVMRARIECGMGFLALITAFVALAGIAYADAWQLTHSFWPALLSVFVQIVQMLFIVNLLLVAERHARDEIRAVAEARAKAERDKRLMESNIAKVKCQYCPLYYSPRSVKRHEAKCRCKPA